MSEVRGKVCVVTGAGSGIGRALALELARRGARAVAISDIKLETAQATAELIGAGTEIHTAALDVSDREAFAAYASEVAGTFGQVHQIYNNAGVADNDPITEFDYDRYERILNVNLWGVIYGTKEFLPHLIASGDGHVINVSSLNGIMAQQGLSAYCASKFAVRGFTESVAFDLKGEGLPVRTTVVHPGGIKTSIADSAMEWARSAGLPVTPEQEARKAFYNEKLLKMDPARAARIVIDGVESNNPRVLVGNDAKMLDALVRLMPRRWPMAFGLLERRFEKELEARGIQPKSKQPVAESRPVHH
ncbi:MAG TPA: SDR family oxidoreductase [Solirubrobacterales bacterium]|nr:SDR family oxidoreductase [Solirubrobacterales bacterium]